MPVPEHLQGLKPLEHHSQCGIPRLLSLGTPKFPSVVLTCVLKVDFSIVLACRPETLRREQAGHALLSHQSRSGSSARAKSLQQLRPPPRTPSATRTLGAGDTAVRRTQRKPQSVDKGGSLILSKLKIILSVLLRLLTPKCLLLLLGGVGRDLLWPIGGLFISISKRLRNNAVGLEAHLIGLCCRRHSISLDSCAVSSCPQFRRRHRGGASWRTNQQ
mmetsp:Transcript_131478/g.332070  ORF Transcript_131478/g.332070 Transcript_131478/m.332070 type:complete len:217 (-) Transcript_131478:120-770(-)